MPPETFDIGGDLTVNRLGFGAMRVCGPDIVGAPDDEANARQVLRDAVDHGVDFIDTADAYGPGTSERLIGETLALDGAVDDGRDRVDAEDVVVATKAGLLRNGDGDWLRHGAPDYIRNQVLASRDRLRVDTIDCYQYHAPDEDVPFEEAVTAFGELKDDGFVRHVGLSNVTVDQLMTARDHVEVATVQNQYNVADRRDEDVLAACEAHGIGFMPYFPVGAGSLGALAEPLDVVAANHDASRYQVALAWLLHHSDVTLPIPGTSDRDHLAENVAAATLELAESEVARLDRVA
ncbi:oxidoreductase [Haloglomus irregulare]|uniref:Oxidoreductase n=1 Tax=Haloglomus irregulare TaxID=2234134 RepID=A0A554N9G7_9EURY|nr:aldo/keto reductase [Haloglomus irregulare]TSD14021.1 oxidoreductase [Haloglomus irregulare]